MKTRSARAIRRATAALLSAAAAIAIHPSTAQAASVSWQGGSGNWENAPSWSTASLPSDGVHVYVGQNYANINYVNAAFPNTVLGELTFDATNTATLTMTQHVLSAEEENLGNVLNGAMIQSGGINNITTIQGLSLGNSAGSSGTYTLSSSSPAPAS